MSSIVKVEYVNGHHFAEQRKTSSAKVALAYRTSAKTPIVHTKAFKSTDVLERKLLCFCLLHAFGYKDKIYL